MKLTIIDCESTGIPTETDHHALVELGWTNVFLSAGKAEVGETLSLLVNPSRPIPAEASAVHHLVDADVANACTPDQACMRVMQEEPDYWVAFNADFDRNFFGGGDIPWICAYKAALRIWPDAPSHRNQTIRYFLGLDLDRSRAEPAHRAGPDTYVTAHMLALILEDGLATIEDMVRWSKGHPLLPRITFGKHKGLKWEEAPIDYLNWIVERSDMDAAIKANARARLKARRAA